MTNTEIESLISNALRSSKPSFDRILKAIAGHVDDTYKTKITDLESTTVKFSTDGSITVTFDVLKSPDITASDDFTIKTGTNKTLVLQQPVYVDIDFPIIIRSTGANIPILTTLNGNITMPQWQENDFNVCESQEFVHMWFEGSTVYWHIHLTTNSSDKENRYVKFELEYGYNNGDNTQWIFPAAITTADILIPADTPSKTMMIISLVSFTPTDGKIGGHAVARLKRIASTSLGPSADPWIPMLQMHVACDTQGSREIGTK